MGMYDTLSMTLQEASYHGLVCAAGHPASKMQTKHFGQKLECYTLAQGRLWTFERQEVGELIFDRARDTGSEDDRDRMRQHTVRTLKPFHIDVVARCYQQCQVCEPVLSERRSKDSFDGDLLSESLVWMEYEIEFRAGRLAWVKPVRVESRDDLRREIAEQGGTSLADDHPLVEVHRKWKAERQIDRWEY